ncbi:alcohol dehydrogenase catalytic domain-containing protein [Paenibacillus piri]|uniref:Galactitol-1-phosphate 5-dehydrogenase n=1 Tax=Paenibacillus piri TaxID=2547395 RepID=A0A4R5KY06_9BACL|nr:alcohol dehydrogenase catalytic domain-containing protein [Paenibacillus piri]TDG00099.1 galactitol-1-phosphate 5-dehydrogenase [Paenibacillus piri]
MKSLVWTRPEMMEIQEGVEPVMAEEEVLLKVDAVGICGSELEGYLGHNSLRVPPLVMGHEFSGTIAGVGSRVQGLKTGQKAVVNPLSSCGRCNSCRKGLVQLCKERSIVGIHRPGAFAEYVNVPAASIHIIPETLNPFRASLTEPLACSLRAVRRAMADHPFANVVVIGAGTIGLLSFLVARILGASRVVVVDMNEARLQTPKRLGAYGTISPAEPGYIGKIRDAMGPSGIDVVIDAVGYQPTRSAAIELVNPGGTVMNIGLGIDQTQLPVNVCIRSEISILHSFCYQAQDFHDALQLLVNGQIDETGWSEIRPLHEGNQAFQDLLQGSVRNAKIFLKVEE